MEQSNVVNQSIRALYGPHAAQTRASQQDRRLGCFLHYDENHPVEREPEEDLDDLGLDDEDEIINRRWIQIPDGPLAKLLPGSSPKAEEMVAVTWNLWFADYRRDARILGILSLVLPGSSPVAGQDRPVDVLCFQEVIPATLELILHDPVAQRDWFITDFGLQSSYGWYGTMILIRKSFLRSLCPDDADALELSTDLVRYRVTKYSRTLLTARVSVQGKPILVVGTTHLESMPGDTPFRKNQIEQGLQELAAHDDAALVWCGDTNIMSSDELQPFYDAGFVDGFAQTHADDFDGSAESSFQIHPVRPLSVCSTLKRSC